MKSQAKKLQAISLRQKGKSYSEIGSELSLSKSTLSGWLQKVSVSPSKSFAIKQKATLIRVEKIRAVKSKKKQLRLGSVLERVSSDIEKSENHLFIAGFYLYWGEGTKTAPYTVSLTNSDPAIINCFIEWLLLLGVAKVDLRVKLHIYSDQNEKSLQKYWSAVTGVPVENFNKSYRKSSQSGDKTYKGMFGFGTCVVAYHDRDMYEYVLQGIGYLRQKYGGERKL
ncbi:hypothetical protein K2Q16_03400 [Patescibacteria group bacterium]|nr:hypothetical protein [Patescibacteria group bacterium]